MHESPYTIRVAGALAALAAAAVAASIAGASSAVPLAFSGNVCGLLHSKQLILSDISAPCVAAAPSTNAYGTIYSAHYGTLLSDKKHYLAIELIRARTTTETNLLLKFALTQHKSVPLREVAKFGGYVAFSNGHGSLLFRKNSYVCFVGLTDVKPGAPDESHIESAFISIEAAIRTKL